MNERTEDPTVKTETGRLELAQPTRARLFALLRESGEPQSTAELAELAGMHPNGIRNHLERLWRAGLVERNRSASRRRGRPRDEWALTPAGIQAERELDGGDNGEGRLAGWLARAFPGGASHRRRIEAIGEEAGLATPVQTEVDAEDAFYEVLDRLGFDPVAESAGEGFRCRLGRCPYREAARENREAVCTLHRGLTRGLLETIDPELRLTEFEPRDPDLAGCLIGVSTGPDDGE